LRQGAEEPLPAGGSCLLGSINLSEFVINPFTQQAEFNYKEFERCVHIIVKAMNDVLDEGLPLHPLQEQKESVKDWRQIGIGIMGLADMLIKMGIKYGSKDSLEICNNIGYELINNAVLSSALLAKEYGSYPMYNKDAIFSSSFFNDNIIRTDIREVVSRFGLRNSQLLTSAPTGSLSTMIGISGGIEPVYQYYYQRKTESLHGKDVYYKVFTPIVEEYMKLNNITDEKELPLFFTNAMRLNYKDRIEMQSIWQNHIDASISSTINVPEYFTKEQVEELYMYAWEKGLKGVTIYRDNCARTGILTTTDNNEIHDEEIKEFPRGFIEEVPEGLNYRKYKLSTGCGKLYFFVGIDESDGKIYDCFCNTDGVSGCNVNTQAVSRLVSANMRGGVPMEYIVEQLDKAGVCPSFQYKRGKGENLSPGKSCASAIANVIKSIMKEFETEEKEEKKVNINPKPKKLDSCPSCGEKLIRVEGCMSCLNCGFSRCN
jgi:ribonucleoside-diphosphate reductase alpha chain